MSFARLGPMSVLPGSSEWHAWHLRKTLRPFSTSPLSVATVAATNVTGGTAAVVPSVSEPACRCDSPMSSANATWVRIGNGAGVAVTASGAGDGAAGDAGAAATTEDMSAVCKPGGCAARTAIKPTTATAVNTRNPLRMD